MDRPSEEELDVIIRPGDLRFRAEREAWTAAARKAQRFTRPTNCWRVSRMTTGMSDTSRSTGSRIAGTATRELSRW
jgi:hypothetical protein